MQSSFKIIKSKEIDECSDKCIVTSYAKNIREIKDTPVRMSEEQGKILLDNYETLAYNIIANAQRKAEKIISNSYDEATQIQIDAIKTGKKQGYDAAYTEGYEKNVAKANAEVKIIQNNSDQMLLQTGQLYEDYFKLKEVEIKETILNIVENILQKETIKADALDKPIFEALTQIKNTKTYVIKVNGIHVESIKQKIEEFKVSLPFKGDIFVIEDKALAKDIAVISRDSGKTVISIDAALEKLRELFS
jgi:flagellar assembly protein FliH